MSMEPNLVIFGIGLLLICVGTYKWNSYHRLKSWLTAKAEIVSIEFVENRVAANEISVTIYIKPEITYKYLVNGKEYVSSGFSPEFMNYAFPREEFESEPWSKWKEGMEVEVKYNSSNAQESYVITEPSSVRTSNYYALIVAGLMVLAFGIYIRGLNA